MKNLSFLKKLKLPRHYLLLGTLGAILFGYGMLEGVSFYLDWKRDADEKISQGQRLLTQYEEILNERALVEGSREKSLKKAEEVEAKLIAGETPQLGAANLQDVIRQLAEKNTISLRSFRILEPKEIGMYRKVSLQIDFNPTYSMKNLGQFLYDLEHQNKALMVSEMDLLIFNPRMANNIQGNLVISALMRGAKAREKTKEDKAKEARKDGKVSEGKGKPEKGEGKTTGVKEKEDTKAGKPDEKGKEGPVKVKVKDEKTIATKEEKR